jgi:hypothetical protein
MDFQTFCFDKGNDLPYILYVPAYAATAWYHQRLAPDLQGDLASTVQAAASFAYGEYMSALFQGDALPTEQRTAVVENHALPGSRRHIQLQSSHRHCALLRGCCARPAPHCRPADSRFTGTDRTRPAKR